MVWFVGFYGISTFIGYLTPNPFYVNNLFYLKQFTLALVHSLIVKKNFHFKLFKQLYVTIQLSVNTVLMSKNSSISNNSVKQKHAV